MAADAGRRRGGYSIFTYGFLLKAPDRLPGSAGGVRRASRAAVQVLRVLVSEDLLAAAEVRPHNVLFGDTEARRGHPVHLGRNSCCNCS